MKTYQAYAPGQSELFPPSPREWLPEGHLAYFVMDVVAELDAVGGAIVLAKIADLAIASVDGARFSALGLEPDDVDRTREHAQPASRARRGFNADGWRVHWCSGSLGFSVIAPGQAPTQLRWRRRQSNRLEFFAA